MSMKISGFAKIWDIINGKNGEMRIRFSSEYKKGDEYVQDFSAYAFVKNDDAVEAINQMYQEKGKFPLFCFLEGVTRNNYDKERKIESTYYTIFGARPFEQNKQNRNYTRSSSKPANEFDISGDEAPF